MVAAMRSLLHGLVVLAAVLPSNPLATAPAAIRRRAGPSRAGWCVESAVEEALERPTEEALERPTEETLSPFLREMVDEQRELQMHVGKAMDAFRRDYPDFLRRTPEYAIYHDDVTFSASDGQVQLHNLGSYKQMVGVVRRALAFLYDADKSVVQSRMVYDPALAPKLGGTVHVDGVSVYSLDLAPASRGGEGKVVEHRVERLLVNGAELRPPYP